MALNLLSNCHFDNEQIKTLYLGSKLTNGNPITYPIEYITVSGSSDSIIAIEAFDYVNNIITIGGQLINVNKIMNTGDNITFNENLVINANGRTYEKILTFEIPNVTLFLINQIKDYVLSSNGLAQLAPTIALLVDVNDNNLLIGYDRPLFLQNNNINVGENNGATLSYKSTSFSRARSFKVI